MRCPQCGHRHSSIRQIWLPRAGRGLLKPINCEHCDAWLRPIASRNVIGIVLSLFTGSAAFWFGLKTQLWLPIPSIAALALGLLAGATAQRTTLLAVIRHELPLSESLKQLPAARRLDRE